MRVIEREFHRSARGPAPGDVDIWRLVLNRASGALFVRHEWRTERHSGVSDAAIAEFLAQPGDARAALVERLFGEAMAEPA